MSYENDMTSPNGAALTARTDWNNSDVRHQLTRLAQVAEATASAVIITDVEGVTVWVNEGFSRITGYSFDEAVGRVPGRLLQGLETNRGEAARVGAAIRARQSVAAELINYAKDGRRYWIGMKIEPLLAANGEIDGFMAIEADITQRLEHNKALEQLIRRFNLATSVARIGVYERDVNGDNLWWNDMMSELFGQDRARFIPTMEAWTRMVHPEDSERIRREAGTAVQNMAAADLQYRIVRPDGVVRHVQSIIGAVAGGQDGGANRVVGVTLDVTERVEAAEREQALQQQLRVSSHQAGMAEIATGVLHNVGNVLNSLGIANTIARRDLKALRLDRLEQATALLHSNSGSLATFLTEDERGRHLAEYLPALSAQMSAHARLIDAELNTTEQLLQHLSDIVSAQQELAGVGGRYESIHLHELVETALLVHASELAQIELVRQFEELPPIMTDRHKLLQILVNLISNARDAVQAKAALQHRIVVRLARDGDGHVLVIVEDSGIGMSEDVLSRLWRFGFTTKKGGHGFGLHNSANAAQQIGATLTAHSNGPGNGSQFTLRLPIDKSKPMLCGVAA